jgi:hypothetical protein
VLTLDTLAKQQIGLKSFDDGQFLHLGIKPIQIAPVSPMEDG